MRISHATHCRRCSKKHEKVELTIIVHIKICGITNLEDAVASVEAGADMLGFNFYTGSSRYIAPDLVRSINEQMPAEVLSVGVFVNEDSPDDVARIARQAGLSVVQLHGDESPDYCRELRTEFQVIKALRISNNIATHEAEELIASYDVDGILLDAFTPTLRGGTGHTFDWAIARNIREAYPRLFLAGGLTPDNIAEAVLTVRPFGVDACSGLESSPGRKDHLRVREFIASARLLSHVKP